MMCAWGRRCGPASPGILHSVTGLRADARLAPPELGARCGRMLRWDARQELGALSACSRPHAGDVSIMGAGRVQESCGDVSIGGKSVLIIRCALMFSGRMGWRLPVHPMLGTLSCLFLLGMFAMRFRTSSLSWQLLLFFSPLRVRVWERQRDTGDGDISAGLTKISAHSGHNVV